jgi:competence protein ComFC
MLELLLPQRCLGCGRHGEQLCGACVGRLPRLEPPLCARCGAPTAWPVARCRECAGRRIAFASARAALAYEGDVRVLVSAWKERGLRRLASVAAEVVVGALPRPDATVITFVPADPDRGGKRGHHPAERLAHELGVRWELPVGSLLGRPRPVRPQRGLPLAERRHNVAGAFRAAARVPARLALVDDVYTSGATAAAAASALRKGGARRIEVVTLARVVR